MSINVVERIDDRVRVETVLVSVSDKTDLEELIPRLLKINPGINFLSTGGTFGHVSRILGDRAPDRLRQVSDYTGQPETQGGLVKTLDFKIYLGLLTETYNEHHKADLERSGAIPIQMVIVNLYPFRDAVARPGANVEDARGNIDIGGPCMLRAAAKNFIRVAPLVDPADYGLVATHMAENDGAIALSMRYRLAQKAFDHTAGYDRDIANFLSQTTYEDVRSRYKIERS